MKTLAYRLALAAALAGLVASCAAPDPAQQMYARASALTKLSSAVEAVVVFRKPSPAMSDGELLRLSAADMPAVLQAFEPYDVRVLRHGEAVVLLVCEKAGGRAVLEDASCTARLDRHHWRDAPAAACEFTLRLPQACAP